MMKWRYMNFIIVRNWENIEPLERAAGSSVEFSKPSYLIICIHNPVSRWAVIPAARSFFNFLHIFFNLYFILIVYFF